MDWLMFRCPALRHNKHADHQFSPKIDPAMRSPVITHAPHTTSPATPEFANSPGSHDCNAPKKSRSRKSAHFRVTDVGNDRFRTGYIPSDKLLRPILEDRTDHGRCTDSVFEYRFGEDFALIKRHGLWQLWALGVPEPGNLGLRPWMCCFGDASEDPKVALKKMPDEIKPRIFLDEINAEEVLDSIGEMCNTPRVCIIED